MSEKRGKRPRKENNIDLSNKIFGKAANLKTGTQKSTQKNTKN